MAALDTFHSSKKGNEIELALNSVFDAISMRYSALTLFCGGAAETFDRPYKGRKKKTMPREAGIRGSTLQKHVCNLPRAGFRSNICKITRPTTYPTI